MAAVWSLRVGKFSQSESWNLDVRQRAATASLSFVGLVILSVCRPGFSVKLIGL